MKRRYSYLRQSRHRNYPVHCRHMSDDFFKKNAPDPADITWRKVDAMFTPIWVITSLFATVGAFLSFGLPMMDAWGGVLIGGSLGAALGTAIAFKNWRGE